MFQKHDMDRLSVNRFKQALQQAKREGRDRFVFDGYPIMVSYAKTILRAAERRANA